MLLKISPFYLWIYQEFVCRNVSVFVFPLRGDCRKKTVICRKIICIFYEEAVFLEKNSRIRLQEI